MKDYILFQDAEQGVISLPKGKQYFETKDSTSKSGHSLVTQIEMTHAGIVTRNLGFYMPSHMRDGASSFNEHFNKPVIIGHDDDADPVGRVIDAKYIDTSKELRINDKYLSSFMEFNDKKKGKKRAASDLTDFAQYVMKEYWGKDNYRGLGHIRGYLKISDAKSIEKILDERYLTVSTSMTADAAYCSECGQDWVSEGPCDHDRGQVYDSGIPVVLIPGAMRYNHLGIVTEPADVFAAKFTNMKLVKNDKVTEVKDSETIKKLQEEFKDRYAHATNLFTYNDKRLISLSDETGTNLIDVKNEIQNIEDSLNKTERNMFEVTLDGISASINLYKSGENEDGNYESTEVHVRKYVSDLDESALKELASKAMGALDSKDFKNEEEFKDAVLEFLKSEVEATPVAQTTEEDSVNEEKTIRKIKVLNDKFKLVDGEAEYAEEDIQAKIEEISAIKDHGLTKKEVKELANAIVRAPLKDALFFNHEVKEENKLEDMVKEFAAFKESRFKLTDASPEDIIDKMNEILAEDKKITEEKMKEITSKDCAGSNKYFPVIDSDTAKAAKMVLGLAVASDSLKGRILGQIEKLSAAFADEEEQAVENFDSAENNSDNVIEFTDEELIAKIEELKALAEERGILSDSDVKEKEQEIEILETQLDAANDEIDLLSEQLEKIQDRVKKDLAEKVVDAKITKGLIKPEDKEAELKTHLERTEDSLNDSLKDLGTFKDDVKNISELEAVENPTINDSANSTYEEVEGEEPAVTITDAEKKMKRTKAILAANRGKLFAEKYFKSYNN